MAHSLSAKKRVRQNVRHRARNRWRKHQFREAIKAYLDTILHGTIPEAETKLRGIYQHLDQVAATGTIHKNKAARTKGRLATRLNTKKASQAA